MVEVVGVEEVLEQAEELAPEDTLADQVIGILREVLEQPGLCESSKVRLRRLLVKHRGHPEQALLEHLRGLGVQPRV